VITEKDHQRWAEAMEAAKKRREEKSKEHSPLLEQKESASATTGDEKFDKLIRALEVRKEGLSAKLTQEAVAGMDCIQDEGIRLHQAIYFYTKGRLDENKEIAELPARILAEAKSQLV
jgi:hypothetical protein